MQRCDADHHLWRNGRLWWTAFVVIEEGVRQVRVRRSLETLDVAVARERRDALIRQYAERPGCVVPLRRRRRRAAAAAVPDDGALHAAANAADLVAAERARADAGGSPGAEPPS